MRSITLTDYKLFINCGGGIATIGNDEYHTDTDTQGASYFNSFGDKWAYSSTGDFVGNDGQPYIATNISVLNMPNPELYMTARLNPLSLKYYGICLQNGNYKVDLHFAEIMFTDNQTYFSLGRRLFDVSIQVISYCISTFCSLIHHSSTYYFLLVITN